MQRILQPQVAVRLSVAVPAGGEGKRGRASGRCASTVTRSPGAAVAEARQQQARRHTSIRVSDAGHGVTAARLAREPRHRRIQCPDSDSPESAALDALSAAVTYPSSRLWSRQLEPRIAQSRPTCHSSHAEPSASAAGQGHDRQQRPPLGRIMRGPCRCSAPAAARSPRAAQMRGMQSRGAAIWQ